MTTNHNSIAPTPGDVKIRTSAGAIVVTTPALFDCSKDVLHTLIERVFQSSAVQSVSVDRRQETVEIRFDRQALDSRSALRLFSESLSAPPATTFQSASLLRPYLDRIPGRVKRIERRRESDKKLFNW